MKGKCPFGKTKCEECVLFRKGMRYYDTAPTNKTEPVPFEECAINIAVDCLEQIVSRSIGQQAATEQMRNSVMGLGSLFQGIMQKAALEHNRDHILEIKEM
jgi:hypothetical protein